ncbi:hypothetical protein [Kribbella deserti]|uniref:TrbL/VirB6 plasmid conjugal transfer protein n=1 Tax=Kribbella deserti TaxID=1926257 RepID=A0ABV6QMF1_9ACTN
MVASMIVLCSKYNPLSWPGCVTRKLGEAVDAVFAGFWNLIYKMFAGVIADAVGGVIKAVGSLWIYVPTLHASEGGNYSPVATVSFMRGQTLFLTAAVAVVAMIIGGARMAYQHHGESARELLRSMLTLVIVTLGGVAMVTVLTEAGDLLAKEFIDRAVQESGMGFAENLVKMIAGPMATQPMFTLPLIIVLGFAAVLMSFLQIIMMLVRNGMLILLVGILPLAAAATNTEMGKAWFKRCCGWLIAFIAYKPFAALIYATAIMLAGNQDSLVNVLTGLMMMALSIIALPALLRLVSPPGGS